MATDLYRADPFVRITSGHQIDAGRQQRRRDNDAPDDPGAASKRERDKSDSKDNECCPIRIPCPAIGGQDRQRRPTFRLAPRRAAEPRPNTGLLDREVDVRALWLPQALLAQSRSCSAPTLGPEVVGSFLAAAIAGLIWLIFALLRGNIVDGTRSQSEVDS